MARRALRRLLPAPEHVHGYRFDGYRAALGPDWYGPDRILRAWLARHGVDARGVAFVAQAGRDAATTFRDAADEVERAENQPRLARTPGRVPHAGDVLLAPLTRDALARVHGSGLWDPQLDARARYAAVYLWAQNGEWGVMCSLACTDGLVRAVRALGSGERASAIVRAIEHATPDAYVHGAQFVTEVQGGSDAGANQLRAIPEADGTWRLYGPKWFCSNPTADHWLVTARPEGAVAGPRGVGLFLVPQQWETAPNGHVVERLKDKLGTRALATAELRFEGARAWALGSLGEGLKHMVSLVLTTSRVHNVLASAALARAAARHARAYADFRTAFGRPIASFPTIASAVERLEDEADLTEAGALALVDTFLDASPDPRRALWRRVLISLAKAVTARRATQLVHDAITVLGGNGIEERFSELPRLWRDGLIFETWEGPYTLLLAQALEDLERFGTAGEEAEWLAAGLGGTVLASDADELARILSTPEPALRALAWADYAPRLYRRFEEAALARWV